VKKKEKKPTEKSKVMQEQKRTVNPPKPPTRQGSKERVEARPSSNRAKGVVCLYLKLKGREEKGFFILDVGREVRG